IAHRVWSTGAIPGGARVLHHTRKLQPRRGNVGQSKPGAVQPSRDVYVLAERVAGAVFIPTTLFEAQRESLAGSIGNLRCRMRPDVPTLGSSTASKTQTTD